MEGLRRQQWRKDTSLFAASKRTTPHKPSKQGKPTRSKEEASRLLTQALRAM